MIIKPTWTKAISSNNTRQKHVYSKKLKQTYTWRHAKMIEPFFSRTDQNTCHSYSHLTYSSHVKMFNTWSVRQMLFLRCYSHLTLSKMGIILFKCYSLNGYFTFSFNCCVATFHVFPAGMDQCHNFFHLCHSSSSGVCVTLHNTLLPLENL